MDWPIKSGFLTPFPFVHVFSLSHGPLASGLVYSNACWHDEESESLKVAISDSIDGNLSIGHGGFFRCSKANHAHRQWSALLGVTLLYNSKQNLLIRNSNAIWKPPPAI